MSLPRADALTHTEVEAIVRAVLRRLRGSLASGSLAGDVAASAQGVALVSSAPSVAGAVRLDLRLLALEHLREHWSGLRLLQVPAGCVVTPAVRDELRQRGVALERFAETCDNSQQATAVAAKLMVLAPRNQQAGLVRQLSAYETKLQWFEGESLGTGLTDLQQHLADGRGYALCCTPRPFAAIAQIASQLPTLALQLPTLEDLPRAIEQAQPKLIVVDSTRWHTGAISQLVRNWTRSFSPS